MAGNGPAWSVVKEVIGDFIDKGGTTVSDWSPFREPLSRSALTLDKEHLQKNLSRLRVGLTHQTGTNIGSALAEGINRLRSLDSKSKILILLTDGKDEPASTQSSHLRRRLKKDKIKVYTIAIGSNARTRSYLYDPSTRGVLRYPNGREIVKVSTFP